MRRDSLLLALLVLVPACFDAQSELRGKPCTSDASCGGLTCEYGVCGGPQRCEKGAGVGDFCFALTPDSFEVGERPRALAVGLVDPDGKPDLVVANAGTLSLLLNDGAGGFGAASESAALGDPIRELVIGHVDTVGLADIVGITEGNALVVVPLVRSEAAPPSFGAVAIAASGLVAPSKPRVGDLVDDAEHTPDVAALISEGLDVRRQNAPLVFTGGLVTSVPDATDIRLLGQGMDRAYIGAPNQDAVVSHSRNPSGTFSARATIDVGAAPEHFVLDDMDLDHYADLFTVSDVGQVWLTRGKDAGLDDWHMPVAVYDLGWTPEYFATANLDDDDSLELVVAGGPENGRRDLYLFDNDSDGRPIYGGSLGMEDVAAVALIDIEPDGVPELVVVDGESGLVRIAKRTVAPPPPGHESTTGVDPSAPEGSSDPSADSVDPGTSDPSVADTGPDPTSDPTIGGCVDGFMIGDWCYVTLGFYSTPSGSATNVEIADATNDGYEDMLVGGGDGFVALFASLPTMPPAPFEQPTESTWSVSSGVNDITVAPLDSILFVNHVLIAHGEGIGVRLADPVNGNETVQVDWPIELGTSHPIVAPFYDDPEGTGLWQVVCETNGMLASFPNIRGSGEFVAGEPTTGIYDVELGASDVGYAALTAASDGMVPYVVMNGSVMTYPAVGGLGPRVNLEVSLLDAYIVSTDGVGIDFTFQDPMSDVDSTHLWDAGKGETVDDLEFADLNGDFFDDFVVLLNEGTDYAIVQVWLMDPLQFAFVGPMVFGAPGIVDVAVRRVWGEQGSLPSELVFVDSYGNVTHYGAGYLVQ
jgi:hypothetical protein